MGNPLLPPREVKNPTYTGPKWTGFDPDTIIIIEVTNVQIFPPGGVGEIPPPDEPEPPSTAGSGGGDEAEPVAILRPAIEQCIADLQAQGFAGSLGDPSTFTYSAAPGSAPDVYQVTVTNPNGQAGTWSVNVATRDLTPADPLAAADAQVCPNLA